MVISIEERWFVLATNKTIKPSCITLLKIPADSWELIATLNPDIGAKISLILLWDGLNTCGVQVTYNEVTSVSTNIKAI